MVPTCPAPSLQISSSFSQVVSLYSRPHHLTRNSEGCRGYLCSDTMRSICKSDTSNHNSKHQAVSTWYTTAATEQDGSKHTLHDNCEVFARHGKACMLAHNPTLGCTAVLTLYHAGLMLLVSAQSVSMSPPACLLRKLRNSDGRFASMTAAGSHTACL
jgi:hypothetical protein